MLRFRPFSKLRNKLIFYFLLVALVPLVSMGAFNYSKSKTALKKQILSGLEDVAYSAIDRIGQAMHTSYIDVQHWAQLSPVIETLEYMYFERANEIFRNLTKNNKLYRAVVLFDKQGKLMATSDPTLLAKPEDEQRMEFDREYIEGALGEHMVSVRNFRYSGLIDDYTVSFSSLVKDEKGKPIGIITLFINWAMVQEFATGEKIRGDEDRIGMLLGSDGQTIIAYHDPSFISTPLQYLFPTQLSDLTSLGEEGGSGEIEIRGVRKCVAFHRTGEFQGIKLLNWTCLVFVDSERLLTPINILKYNILIFVFVVIGSVLVTIYFVAGGIVNPLGSFTTAATRATEAGDLTQTVEVTTEDEIGQLSKSFQDMMNWMKEMAGVARSIAGGNLDQKVEVKSDRDTFGKAFQSMVVSLKNAQDAMQREQQAVQRLAEERGVVAKIGQIIGSTLEIEKVYEHFAEEVGKIIPFDRIAISLVYPEKGTLLIAHITGKEVPGYKSGDVAPLAGTITEETVQKRSSQLIQTDDRDEVVKHFPSLLPSFQAGLRSFIAVPLISKDQVIGVLHIFLAKLKAYTEADVGLAESIGTQIAGAIANAQLYVEQKRTEEELKRTMEELARSNTDLEQFAYVASHDLREPLRKVGSYTEMLARRYKDQLDSKADKFIGYIMDGTTRMQGLINDLLKYSRVGRDGDSLEPTNFGDVMDQVISDLEAAIHENSAAVTHDPLPTVMGNASQITQLFQNLIGNAIKFRGNDPPSVHVSAEQKNSDWVFSVRDNGIGIEPEYAERIFVIFQRLHTRAEYSGTGIGLAICKKIVECHGGRIWIDSEPGKGTTFHFTIPAKE